MSVGVEPFAIDGAVAAAEPTTDGYDALAVDGRIVRIRTAGPQDAAGLRVLYERASDRSLYLRFFSMSGRGQIGREVQRLIRPASPDHLALVALDGDRVVGVVSYERQDRRPDAEFAALVSDDEHGRGIGILLLEEILCRAHAAGIRDLTGDVLMENSAMLRLVGDLAPGTVPHLEAGVAEVRVSTTADETALAAIDLRERTAERRALRPLLRPVSVAVVGASREPRGVGHEALCNLLEHGFTGPVYPVNRHATEVAGRRAYPRLSALPGPVDLAVIAVPPVEVEAVLSDAARAGVRAAVVLTAGFAEDSPAGAAAAARLVRLARAHHIRLVGPSCIGVANTDPLVRLTATVCTCLPQPGGLAVATQSGAVGIAVLDHAARLGIGVSSFVSLGNRVDVSSNDLLAYWYDDPATCAVALYLESFGNPRKFGRIARALARRKPVLAVKSGQPARARHTGGPAVAAASDIAVESLFAQAGVVRTDTLGELFDAARLLVGQPLPEGDRLGIVGNAHGLNVLAAGAADAAGLVVADIAGGNPVDLPGAASPTAMTAALGRLAAAREVDAIVVTFAAARTNDTPAMLAALATAADTAATLPIVVVMVGVPDAPLSLGQRRAPVFALPEPAVRALGHAARYAAWRREPLGGRPLLADIDATRARELVTEALARGDGWQPAPATAQLLDCYAIAVQTCPVQTSPSARGVELIAGVIHDRLFGSLVMLGLGGRHRDLAGHRTFRLLPITDLDAGRMWRSMPGTPLTDHSGTPTADVAALENLLMRLGQLAEDLPEVAQLDLDLLASPHGIAVVGARLRLAAVGVEPDPTLRALPEPAR